MFILIATDNCGSHFQLLLIIPVTGDYYRDLQSVKVQRIRDYELSVPVDIYNTTPKLKAQETW